MTYEAYDVFEISTTDERGKTLGTVEFGKPFGVLPRSALLRIPEVANVMKHYNLSMDWNNMQLWMEMGGHRITFFGFEPAKIKPKKVIPDIKICPKCYVDIQWVRATLCCPKCKKTFGGLQ